MIRCYTFNKIQDIDTKYIQNLQETLLTKSHCMLDLDSQTNPIQNKYFYNDISKLENNISEIHGFSMPITKLGKIISLADKSIHTDRQIEKAYLDTDLYAAPAIINLFSSNVSVDKINRALSIGMLGIKKNRKLIPTKWSITAVDKIISDKLTNEIEYNKTINEIEIYSYKHVHNEYYIVIIPNHSWSFEYIEIWRGYDKVSSKISTDFEHSNSKIYKKIINPISKGAFFASKLGVIEHLYKVKRIAAIIVIRIIQPQYTIPLGVWQVRQGIRQALTSEKNRISVESIEKADNCLYKITNGELNSMAILNSKTNMLIQQKKILQFMDFK